MKKSNIILLHTLIPMIIGGFIYIIFREKNLIMFSWFDYFGAYDIIDYLRLNFIGYNIPNWLLFNYPDGVWIYSFVSLMIVVWDKTKSNIRFLWFGIAPILGIFAEMGQYFRIVPGTYDRLDLIFCLIGSLLPFILIKYNRVIKIFN